MKRRFLVLPLLLLSLNWLIKPTVASAGEPVHIMSSESVWSNHANWERYTYPGDQFSVELPAMPFVYHTQRMISIFEYEKTRVFGVYSQNVVFMVVAYDKPRDSESLNNFAAYPWYGRLDANTTKEIKFGDLKGKEYYRSIEHFASVRHYAKSRVFKTKRHAFLVHAIFASENDPSATRFLDSLDISPEPKGKEISNYYESPKPPVIQPAAPEASGSAGGDKQIASPAKPLVENDPDKILRANEVTAKAVLVYKPDPPYTRKAVENSITGVVRLRAVLLASGRVTGIAVVKSLPDGLTENAIDAARHLLFFPATKDGRPVSQYITLEYNFNIY